MILPENCQVFFGVNMKMDLNLRSHIYHFDGLRQSTEFKE